MITPNTVSAALSVATGLIKLGQRLDQLLAEKAAVQAKLIQVMPAVYAGPSSLQKASQLRHYLTATFRPGETDPFAGDRAELMAELAKADPDNALVGGCYAQVFPECLTLAPFSPDAAYIAALRALLPTVDLSNEDNLAAAFAITAGHDDRGINYTARLGLLVVDVVAEFGAENTSLFVRDPRFRSVAGTVLQRFARPDLEEFTRWSPLLRHALSATLNGALDARGCLEGSQLWLVNLLDVLAETRADAAGGDKFLVGLLRGQSYRVLLSHGVARAAVVLGDDQASAFKQIAAVVLKTAAPMVQTSPEFKELFSEHWGDLLRAGLTALERQGPALLKDRPELVSEVLVAVVKELNQIPQANLLGAETLYLLGDAAIGAVALKPELLTAKVGDKLWISALLESFVKTVSRDGGRVSLSREGLDSLASDVARLLAEHPELIVDPTQTDLARQLLGGVLKAVGELPRLDARSLAKATTQGTLAALAANPQLLGTRYAPLIVELASRLAELITARTLTAIDSTALVAAVVQVLRNNPALFSDAKANLAIVVVDATLRIAMEDTAGVLRGATRTETVRAILIAVARTGAVKLVPLAREAATDLLADVLRDALKQASAELGRRLDLPGLPIVLGGIVAAWARGDLAKINPSSPAFRKLMLSLTLAATLAPNPQLP